MKWATKSLMYCTCRCGGKNVKVGKPKVNNFSMRVLFCVYVFNIQFSVTIQAVHL